MAKPMGSQRAFRSIPAVIAASAPPPAARTLRAANWAAPEKTRIDMAIGATGPMTGPRQHAEGHAEGERREQERQPGAHARADVAVLVHLGLPYRFTTISGKSSNAMSRPRRSSSGAARCAWTSPTASTGRPPASRSRRAPTRCSSPATWLAGAAGWAW